MEVRQSQGSRRDLGPLGLVYMCVSRPGILKTVNHCVVTKPPILFHTHMDLFEAVQGSKERRIRCRLTLDFIATIGSWKFKRGCSCRRYICRLFDNRREFGSYVRSDCTVIRVSWKFLNGGSS